MSPSKSSSSGASIAFSLHADPLELSSLARTSSFGICGGDRLRSGTVINLAFGDWLRTMSPVTRTFVLATIAVPIVIYGLMPRLHRLRARLLASGRTS